MVGTILYLIMHYYSNRFFIADNRIQAIKIAMALLTDIDTGPSRAPPKSISSETVATVTKDLMNLGYQPNIKL